MSIKQSLRNYYAKQGLQGKHLRKALQWDMKAVTAADKVRRGSGRSWVFAPATNLMDLHWGSMPKTNNLYWAKRYTESGR